MNVYGHFMLTLMLIVSYQRRNYVKCELLYVYIMLNVSYTYPQCVIFSGIQFMLSYG